LSNSSSRILVIAGFGRSASLRALVIRFPVILPFKLVEMRLSVRYLVGGPRMRLKLRLSRFEICARVER
jgi:hypothetical protein